MCTIAYLGISHGFMTSYVCMNYASLLQTWPVSKQSCQDLLQGLPVTSSKDSSHCCHDLTSYGITGESLDVKVLRDGALLDLEYQLKQRRPLVPILHGVDCVPSYFIVGGLVFVPLSIPFLEHAYGGAFLKHLHNVETRFYCPQTFLYLDFQYRDDVSKSK